MEAPSAVRVVQALGLGLLLAGCSASRVENGMFHSSKGYQVRLPANGWRVEPDAEADLQLRRDAPAGGMLVNATCEGQPLRQSLPLLTRHLTFGLKNRRTVETHTGELGGQPAEHVVVRGTMDGMEIAVEAVVLKTPRCVHDFLYVAPVGDFEAGRGDFNAFVESFAKDAR
jgi:hypothetical protein